MRLLLIRHGESEADILQVHEGRADFLLTQRGHRQAEAMSEYVGQNYQVCRIYHSTLKRAAQTAGHLAGKTGAPLFPEEGLMEFNNGLVAGLDYATAEKKYPKRQVPIHASVYEQESLLMFRYRAEAALSRILSECGPQDTVAVVTHGGMINQLYHAFLKLPVDSGFFFSTGDAGIHEWLLEEGVRRIAKSNFLPHSLWGFFYPCRPLIKLYTVCAGLQQRLVEHSMNISDSFRS